MSINENPNNKNQTPFNNPFEHDTESSQRLTRSKTKERNTELLPFNRLSEVRKENRQLLKDKLKLRETTLLYLQPVELTSSIYLHQVTQKHSQVQEQRKKYLKTHQVFMSLFLTHLKP